MLTSCEEDKSRDFRYSFLVPKSFPQPGKFMFRLVRTGSDTRTASQVRDRNFTAEVNHT